VRSGCTPKPNYEGAKLNNGGGSLRSTDPVDGKPGRFAAPPEPETAPPLSGPPSLPAETALELTDLWVSEVRTAAAAGRQPVASLLRAEGRLNLSGGTAYDLTTNQLPFNIG
jgi:hypothetical protein